MKLGLTIKVLVLFAATQLLGVYTASRLLPQLADTAAAGISDFTLSGILLTVVFTAVFLFLSFRFEYFGSWLYRVFLTVIIFSAAQVLAGIWFGPTIALIIALTVPLVYWLWQSVLAQNAVMLVTLAAIGAALGLAVTPLTAVIALVVLSFYDIIAVYRTGHMVKLAQGMIRARAIFGFVVPEDSRDFGVKLDQVTPGQGFMILGSGDVILPLLLAASLVRSSVITALLVAGFATLGALLTHCLFTSQKIRRPMAALPPIALMSIVGYLVAIIFNF